MNDSQLKHSWMKYTDLKNAEKINTLDMTMNPANASFNNMDSFFEAGEGNGSHDAMEKSGSKAV